MPFLCYHKSVIDDADAVMVSEAKVNFINSGTGYALFKGEAEKKTYVDKSMLVDAVYRYAPEFNKYICITRPRRFGKSTAANMIASFFDESTAKESRRLFESLKLGEQKPKKQKDSADPLNCWYEQGKAKVIRINMIDLISEETGSYEVFLKTLKSYLIADVVQMYPEIKIANKIMLSKLLEDTGERFIFVIDEWDAIFEMPFMRDADKQDYILFLKSLLKDKRYVSFVYMTGILPIAKYSSGSPLNMFKEFNTFGDRVFYPWFGFTEKEIRELMKRKNFTKPTMKELGFWYDGYVREGDGKHVYNPTSVSFALAEGVCQSHWTGTGPMNEVRDIIRRNTAEVREDVIRMAGGEGIKVDLNGFSVEKAQVNTRDEILSAMVVYGFLAYHDQVLRIPNHELMLKFKQALASEELGLKQTLDASRELLNATLEQRDSEVAGLMEELHDEKIPFFQYNDENSLACVVTVGYLAALDKYKITREDKAGKGYVDFSFEPEKKSDTAILLELKYNRSAKNAIQCIKEREYLQRFKSFKRVLLVGINYSEKTKKHTCLTELVEQK